MVLQRDAGGTRAWWLLVSLLLVTGLQAQDAPEVARMARDRVVDPVALAKALQSTDALVRATAARVATVRDVSAVLPALRAQLGRESNAECARELVRALVMLGKDDEVAYAASQLPRFPSSIDASFADAIARRPDGIARYSSVRGQLRGATLPAMLPYWRGGDPNAVALRLLEAGDVASFDALLLALTDARTVLSPEAAAVALKSDDERVRIAVIWHLARRAAIDRRSVPSDVRALAAAKREDIGTAEQFGRELFRRMAGAKPVERRDALERLKEESISWDLAHLLTPRERTAARLDPGPSKSSFPIDPPAFHLSLALPPGLAPALLEKAGCTTGWIGVAQVTSDHFGRVQDVDTSGIVAEAGCLDVLATLIRLAFATPAQPAAALRAPLLTVLVARQKPCFDEVLVGDVAVAGPVRAGGDVRGPSVIRRVEPYYPDSIRRQAAWWNLIEAQATVTTQGCVRDIRLVRQSDYPELNRAAVRALSQWTFQSATWNGVPVEVVFNQSINFRYGVAQ